MPKARTILWILTLLLIVLMCTQWGWHIGGEAREIPRGDRVDIHRVGGVHITPGYVLLVVTFLAWAAYVVLTFRFFEIRFPALPVLVLLAVVIVSTIYTRQWGGGVGGIAQLGGVFIGGWFIFANCIDTRQRLRAAVDLFSIVVGAIVVFALWQYRAESEAGNAFAIAGTFGNRNVLGAFFASALPFLFALGLYEERTWQRFALVLLVALGAAVTLSAGALIAIAVACLFVAALKSRTALLGTVVAITLGLTVVPGFLSLPRHTDAVVSSASPFLYNNYLDRRTRTGEPIPGHDEYDTAVRYKRWFAATRSIQGTLNKTLWGAGPGRYNDTVRPEIRLVHTRRADTDSVPDFNISVAEPDSFNMYLVTFVEYGPFAFVALVWLGMWLLGRNLRGFRQTRDSTGRALAVGSAAAVLGAGICAVFSSILVRGVALPFLFVALSGILWPRLPDAAPKDADR